MKKEGFTLIEIIVSIFILTILFSVGTSLNKFAFKLSNNMKTTAYVYEIQNILSYGKAVCREKNKYGKITIDPMKNQIRFVEGTDKIEKVLKIPMDISMDGKYRNILIRPNGKISNGTSIVLIDNYRERQTVTVRVGVDCINIKEDEII
ncbi:prepilin-type N-terminal cleavage/methylation domain-containing protein [Clostridium sp. C2-6-12]|uniref:prepilin-type N-terminal cleavage/methylation domain-containing protein n=1 Tax=Clostridium sp. C2-6-12 TaxID=2698832 RepID=UPI001368E766|nr:prepilin-type N-terminal cleavage/methylation domain-containing protein [Clostridium sp. C2-6-12]